MFGKMKFVALALGSLLVLGSAGVAGAADWRDCDRRVAHERRELDRAIDGHGYYSRQAQHERRELDRIYAECRYRDR
jgi:hypothetical protein